MRRIFKYPLNIVDEQTIMVPMLCDHNVIVRGSDQVLHIGVQNDTPFMWCLVDDDREEQPMEVITHGTGHPADDTIGKEYVGTYVLLDGALVFHVFTL